MFLLTGLPSNTTISNIRDVVKGSAKLVKGINKK